MARDYLVVWMALRASAMVLMALSVAGLAFWARGSSAGAAFAVGAFVVYAGCRLLAYAIEVYVMGDGRRPLVERTRLLNGAVRGAGGVEGETDG